MTQPDYARFELFGYWASIADASGLTRKDRFDPTEVPQILQSLSLVVCSDELSDYKITVWGSRLIDLFQQERTGMVFGQLHHIENWKEIFADYIQVQASGEPRLLTDRTVSSDRQHVEYERLSLPLWGDEGTDTDTKVTHIISQFRILDRKRIPIS